MNNGSKVKIYFNEAYTKALKSENPFNSELEDIEKIFSTKDGKEIYHAVSYVSIERPYWIEAYTTLSKYTQMHFGDGVVVLVYDDDALGIPIEPMIMYICDDGEVRVTEITVKKGENV